MSKLVKNTAIYSSINVFTLMASFFLMPLYTKYMSIEGYGILSCMQVFSSLVIIFGTGNLDGGSYRMSHDYNLEEKKIYFGTIFISILAQSFALSCFLFLFQKPLNLIFPSVPFYPFYVYTILSLILSGSINLLKTIQQVSHNATNYAIISLSSFLLTTVASLYVLIYLKLGEVGLIKVGFWVLLLIFPIAFYLARPFIVFKFDRDMLKAAYCFSLPMIPALVSAWVLNLFDRVLIERFMGVADVAVYSVGFRIANVILLVGSSLSAAYVPFFYAKAAQNDKKVLIESNSIYVKIIGALAIAISFFSFEFLTYFFREEYMASLPIIRLFTLSLTISVITGLMNLMAYQDKKTKAIASSLIVTAIVNICLNLFLIPKLGILGAAIANLIATILNFILVYFVAKRSFWTGIGGMSSVFVFTILLVSLFLSYTKEGVFIFLLKASLFLGFISLILYKDRERILQILNIRREYN